MEQIDHNTVPELILDCKQILDKALKTLRVKLNLIQVGYNLRLEKFTFPELQKLYKTIPFIELYSGNFLSKITKIRILKKLDEKKKNVGATFES